MTHRICIRAVCKVTGQHLNLSAGLGLEVQCKYKFAGQESSIESLRTAIYRCLKRDRVQIKKENFNLLYL